jgi:HlyD family secretion protein
MHTRWLPAFLLLGLALCLAGCDLGRSAPPTPLPTVAPPAVEPSRSSGGVVASGEIAPVQKAALSFTASGRVATVDVALGDEVQAGQLLATLETASQEAQVAQAEATVRAAQANLERLRAGARPEEIAAAEQAVATARAQVAQAEAAVEAANYQCAVAQSAIEASKAQLQSAQAQYRQVESGPSADERAAAEADRKLAEAKVRQAQAAYDRVSKFPDVEMRPEALALEQATLAYQAVQARYDTLVRGATAEDKQVAAAQVDAARAQVAQAEDQALATCAQVDQATAAVEAAKAQQAQAEDQAALVQAGAAPEEIAALQAQVAQADAALQAAQVALDQALLRAPLSGTITALVIRPGETVVPGQIVLSLADLSLLRAETTDLSERDVSRVAVGQEATVFVEALGTEIEGQVAGIAPQANTVGGDVVYTAYIDLAEQVSGLRWGMSADVNISID